jgi:hypothetical protein
MKPISSGSRFFTKKIFPLLWFGFVAFFAPLVVMTGAASKTPVFLAVPFGLAAFGFVLLKKRVWDLVDEVHDGGDFLLVRNGGVEDRVPLSNIVGLSASRASNPPRVTLRLASRGRFGSEIAFSPADRASWNPFARSAIAEDLRVRVDRCREQQPR